MGHLQRPPLTLVRSRFRLLLHALYPSFVFRRSVLRPLSVLSMTFVLSLIAFGFYLVVPFTLVPQLRQAAWPAMLWLALFLWSCSCTLLCYLLTATTVPGRVPATWRPNGWQTEHIDTPGVLAEHTSSAQHQAHPHTHQTQAQAQAQAQVYVQVLDDGCKLYPIAPADVAAAGTAMLLADRRFRFCVHCNLFKPDRAHHCSSCHECVLQMDHHCPFTGNCCIGLVNRKFFILFLYYATLSCSLVATLTPHALLYYTVREDQPTTVPSIAWTVVLLMMYLLCALHAVALAPFAAFHTYLVLNNRTTIENQEPHHPLHLEVLRRTDKTWLTNWNATFGPSPWLWFVPVAYGRDVDGMRWASSHAGSACNFDTICEDII